MVIFIYYKYYINMIIGKVIIIIIIIVPIIHENKMQFLCIKINIKHCIII